MDCLRLVSERSEPCQTLLSLLRVIPKGSGKLAKTLQIQLTIAACIQGYIKDEIDISALDLQNTLDLLTQDIYELRWKPVLIEHLKQFEQATVINELIMRLQENFENYASIHIVDAMRALKYPEFVDSLIESIDSETDDYLCESAQKGLIEIGDAAQTALIERWDQLDDSQQIYGLSIIGVIGGPAAADFAIARFNELMSDDLASACEFFLNVPDVRLLDLLKPELRRKQALIDRAFYISARLLDQNIAEAEAAKTSAMAKYERSKQTLQAFSSGILPRQDYLFLELECPACGAVNRYQAKGVIVDEGPDKESACLLDDEFPCASCNADVEFKFTPKAMVAVTAELLTLQMSNDDADDIDQPLVRIANCRIDGQVMPLSNGLSMVKQRLAQNPTSAFDWLVLGNLLAPINRPKATLDAYRKAAELAPKALDAQYCLANALAGSNKLAEAFDILQTALENKAEWTFLTNVPNASQMVAELYNYLRRHLGKTTVPVLHPSALSLPKKTGRNDPCPCGSGKKFKKCCGQ